MAFLEGLTSRQFETIQKQNVKLDLIEFSAKKIAQNISFSDLDALDRILAVLDLDSIRGVVARVSEHKKAEHADLERRKAIRLASQAYQAHLAATEDARREFWERQLAGTLNPSMQARHIALNEGAL